jgi:uncharacterized Zn finger protein
MRNYHQGNTKKDKVTTEEIILLNLEKLDKNGLLSLFKENIQKNTKLKETLELKFILNAKEPSNILLNLKKELNFLYNEVEQNDDPEFDKIKNLLNWTAENEPASIPNIMKRLCEIGNHAMSFVDEIFYGEEALIECLKIGMKGFEKIDWPDDEKILFCLDLRKTDEYSYTSNLFESFFSKVNKDSWSRVADSLISDLNKIKSLPKDKNLKIDFSSIYRYNALIKDAVEALNNANRKNEVLQLFRKEANLTKEYNHLIEYLMTKKEFKEAKSIILEQLEKEDNWFYLVSKLKDIAKIENDNHFILKILLWEYSYRPNISCYKEIKKTSTKLKKWQQMQDWILVFLETGNKLFKNENPEYYLQTKREKKSFGNKFPDFSELIEIYILEKKPAKVWEYYNLAIKPYLGTPRRFGLLPEDNIARVIQHIQPDESISIWKFLAESSISRANPNGYAAAMPYLKQAKTLLIKIGKSKHWDAYYQELKLQNKNRPRFLDEIAKLSGKKIIDE